MVEDERVKILMDLGLTLLQAKVYLALSQTGKTKIATISKVSKIARQDIYRIMPTLQKLGLAEKIVTAPTMYKPTPIKEGLSILLRHRAEEYTELKEKTKSLFKSFQGNDCKIALQNEEPQLIIVTGKEKNRKTCIKEIQTAQTSIRFVGPEGPIKGALFAFLQDFEMALERGVKIQMITGKPENIKAILRGMPKTFKNPLFRVRYVSNSPLLTLSVYDNKKIHLSTAIPSNINGPHVWSNNSVFALIATAYFNELWNIAEEE